MKMIEGSETEEAVLFDNNDEAATAADEYIIHWPEEEDDAASVKSDLFQEGSNSVFSGLQPLGLTLSMTPSFVNLLQMKLSQETGSIPERKANSNRGGVRINDYVSQCEKLKASNFAASHISIGTWERVSTYEAELVAKCYYAKKKLVWEVLNGNLKSKIEIQWSEILAIRATRRDNEPGILEVELNQPPTFFEETDPQPRKHTMWHPASDFTGGEASTCRRHRLQFPAGVLDLPFEKLMQCDKRLWQLSQRPFPSLDDPKFTSTVYGPYNIHPHLHICDPELAYCFSLSSNQMPSWNTPYGHQTFDPMVLSSLNSSNLAASLSELNFPHINESIYSQDVGIPLTAPRMNNTLNPSALISFANQPPSCQQNQCSAYSHGVLRLDSSHHIENIRQKLLMDAPEDLPYQNNDLGEVQPIDMPPEEAEDVILSTTEQQIGHDEQSYAASNLRGFGQVPNQMLLSYSNTLMNPLLYEDPALECFAALNNDSLNSQTMPYGGCWD